MNLAAQALNFIHEEVEDASQTRLQRNFPQQQVPQRHHQLKKRVARHAKVADSTDAVVGRRRRKHPKARVSGRRGVDNQPKGRPTQRVMPRAVAHNSFASYNRMR